MVSQSGHPAAPADRKFWSLVGAEFPTLKGAPSTAYYRQCEQWLFQRYLGDLTGVRILKTDLWDEAKNTEILKWAAEQGARVYGIDVAEATTRAARHALAAHDPSFVQGDVRCIPFQDDSFDLIYSMGTIEHFVEYRQAVDEIFRVLKPGARAIIGVPNKLDPFLRPLMVTVMNWAGLYSYGMEKSFTHGELKALLECSGFKVRDRSGILFMPGWLRMLDLFLHTRGFVGTRLTRSMVHVCAMLARRCPRLLSHGYLIAAIADKPMDCRGSGRSEEQEAASRGRLAIQSA